MEPSAQHGPQSGDDLIPLVYEELHRLAAARMANERPGHTLQATALVHEAYLRLAGSGPNQWKSRGHFFGAAAEAMRRILVENARRKMAVRHGGGRQPLELNPNVLIPEASLDDVVAVHEALDELEKVDAEAAELVKLRFFVGLTHAEAAAVLGLSRAEADGTWVFARGWLYERMKT